MKLSRLFTIWIMAFTVALQAQNGNDPSSGEWTAPKSAKINPLPKNAEAVGAGQQLYSMLCVICHGEKGKGDGIGAAGLGTKPTDLTSGKVQRQTDGALFWKLSAGNPPMPSLKSALSEEQIWQIVNFVRSLSARKANTSSKPAATDGTTTAGNTTNPATLPKAEKSTAANNKPTKAEVAAKKDKPAKAVKMPGSEVENLDKSAVVKKSPAVIASNPYSDIQDGKKLYRFTCGSCHTIGKGKLLGPDLKGISERFDKAWLHQWIRSSQSLVRAGDILAVRLFEENNKVVMPDQPFLSNSQIDNILKYIEETGYIQKQIVEKRYLKKEKNTSPTDDESGSFFPHLTFGEYFLLGGLGFVLGAFFYIVLVLNKMVRLSQQKP